jgi:hypothetical protein
MEREKPRKISVAGENCGACSMRGNGKYLQNFDWNT